MVEGILSSCNRDDLVTAGMPPRIILDNPTGVYDVKVGRELTIAPLYENAEGASFAWKVDGVIHGTDPAFTFIWDEAGEYYIDLTVTTPGGTVTEEMRVDVLEPGIPYISLPFAGDVLILKTGTDYLLTPEIANTTDYDTDITVQWIIDGKEYSTGRTLHFAAETTGEYAVTVTATNADGSDTRTFTIRVLDRLPFTLEFPSQSYFMTSTTRNTFAGRAVMLRPIISGLDANVFEWSVNGQPAECDTDIFSFTPDAPGEYVVNLMVDGMASASVIVVCVNDTEESRWRKPTSSSSPRCNKVFEWVPAPGQFIGETSSGGFAGNSHEDASAWAIDRLNSEQYVSLGAFGGYIIVGFDHSIENIETSYDFSISANAFFNVNTGTGGSNEPGIVSVSQDVNGNGLPDDEWYELRGSETGKSETISDYAVTYYRPSAPAMNVQWTDCLGLSGTVDYLSAFHNQPYYYPAWIPADSYTLRGTRLKDRTTLNSDTGMWDNNCFAWGYTDNMGGDVLSSNDAGGGEGQRNGFLIKNAMYPDGTHINLRYVDFIRVHTGINSKAGWLGEVSTEVFGFEDLNITR